MSWAVAGSIGVDEGCAELETVVVVLERAEVATMLEATMLEATVLEATVLEATVLAAFEVDTERGAVFALEALAATDADDRREPLRAVLALERVER